MPRPAKGPRLYFREDKGVWIIRDGEKTRSTGCAREHLGEAEKRLAQYIAEKHEPSGSSRPAEVMIADVLNIYAKNKGPSLARPQELVYRIRKLLPFWKDRTVAEIRGETCRTYAKRRASPAAARRELEDLRAAVKHYHKEYGLDAIPELTLPPKAEPRERWATRSEVAKLLWACRKTSNRHVARLILIACYSGTRSGAILGLQWMPNTVGGYPDLESGVMHRAPPRQRKTKKRKPPVRIARKLLGHMKRWKKADQGIRYVIHYQGQPVKKFRNSWYTVVRAAGLDNTGLVIHSLRHSAATWLMQRGVDKWEAAGYLGMSTETLEETYGHHHPDYQRNAAEAL